MTIPSRRTFLKGALGAGVATAGLAAVAPDARARTAATPDVVRVPLTGTVTAVYPAGRALVVRTATDDHPVRVTLALDAAVWWDRPAVLTDIVPGDRVAVTGARRGAEFVATTVEPLYEFAFGQYQPGSGRVRLAGRDGVVAAHTIVDEAVRGRAGATVQDVKVTYRVDARTGTLIAYRITG